MTPRRVGTVGPLDPRTPPGPWCAAGHGTPVLVACRGPEPLQFRQQPPSSRLRACPREKRRHAMTDTVLQSFCERCGTRYTFTEPEEKPEAGRTKLGRLGRRAPEAKAEPGVSTTLPSSEQFKGTFHFCLDCRQYTCASCWNADDGACISCRPPGETREAGGSAAAQVTGAAQSEPTAWPTGDLAQAAEAPAHDHASTPRTASDSPWRQDGSDALAPGTELDEWGRPRAKTQPKSSDDSDASPKPTEGTLDPWRGVVFSTDDDEADAEAKAVAPSAPASSHSETAAPAPMVWPESDQPEGSTAEPEEPVSAWPEGDRKDDQEAASRLGAVTTPVDAGSWARASVESVESVESGAVSEEASESVEPDAPAAEAPAATVEAEEAEVVDAAAASEAMEPAEASADTEPALDLPMPEIHFEEPPADHEAEPDAPATEAPAAIVEPAAVEVVDTAAASEAPEPAEASADAEPAVEPAEVAITPTAATPEVEAAEAPPAEASADAEPAVSLPDPDVAADPAPEPDPAPEAAQAQPEIGFAEPEVVVDPAPAIPVAPAVAAAVPSSVDTEPVAPSTPDIPPEPAPPVSPPAPPPQPAQPPASVPPPSVPAPTAPPSPLAPITPVAPPDGVDVWATSAEPGPFGQPYQAPAATQPPPPTPTVASATIVHPAPQPPAPPPGAAAAPPAPPASPPAAPAAPAAPVAPVAAVFSQPAAMPPVVQPASPPTAPPQPAAPGMMPPPPAQAAAPPPARPIPPPRARANTRACTNCNLPLSAKARFCRRCGSPQA